MAEEQRREVDHEVELERHTHPPKVFPAEHIVCDEIRDFVRTGVLTRFSTNTIPPYTPIWIDRALNSMAE